MALVALRIGIGLHFYSEGVAKLRDPKPYSAAFFGNAKGGFAPLFQGLIWDADGLARLDQEKTVEIWDDYRARVAAAHGFNEDQQRKATAAFEARQAQLADHLEVYADEIKEYRLGLERRDRYRGEAARTEVASLRTQLAATEKELKAKKAEIVGPIDTMWRGYEAELNGLAKLAPTDWSAVALPRIGGRWLDSESIDLVIRYFDAGIGACLVLGLCTRLAAGLGAAFLVSIVLSQMPGAADAVPVWPQAIEALGLIAIAATGAGRFAGLDGVGYWLCCGCCRRKG